MLTLEEGRTEGNLPYYRVLLGFFVKRERDTLLVQPHSQCQSSNTSAWSEPLAEMDADETVLPGDLPTMATLNSVLAPADMVEGGVS
jgi:hypothetical protein